ncbi:MAG: hydrogenase assembly protein HupF [Iamia sp.]
MDGGARSPDNSESPAAAPPGPGSVEGGEAETALASAALTLARRFAAGATMWCIAPEWDEHARHVAVEFVHPVIVGTRALPAVSITAPDPVPALRAVVRPGDVILAVSTSGEASVAELWRRAPAWGATTVWVASGPAPADARVDHLVPVDDPDGSAPHDGRLVLRYHLLWELTHVCFEHPGLVRPPEPADDGEVCITCSDEGRLGEVLGATGGPDAQVRTACGVERIDVSLVGPVDRDQLVLVHAGTAISLVDA